MTGRAVPVFMRIGDGEEQEVGHLDLNTVEAVVTLDGPPDRALARILRSLADELYPED